MRLKCISINVRGLRTASKRDLILRELANLNYDIYFLQETHVFDKQQGDSFARLWRGKCLWSFGTGQSAGVATLFSPKFTGSIDRFIFDSDGRILSALISVGAIKLNIVNIYAPNDVSNRKNFFSHLHVYFISQRELIIGGDFNCVDSTSDKLHSNNVHSADKTSLSSLKSQFLLIDVWRKLNLRVISFTWSNGSNSQASRLDRFFVSKFLFPKVCFCNISPCVFLDQDFLDLDLSLDGLFSHRSGTWKFNSSLLLDTEFMRMMTHVIEVHKLEIDNFDSLGDWWDDLKCVIRSKCIDFSIQKRRKTNSRRSFLTKQLVCAKNILHSGDSSKAALVADLESDLLSLITKEAEGAKIRSRAEWIEKGEKPTRFFLPS